MNIKSVLYKISGVAFSSDAGNFCDDKVSILAQDIKNVQSLGVKVCIVVGGGNIMRGRKCAEGGNSRIICDQIGMLATVINALNLHKSFIKHDIESRVMSAFKVGEMCEMFNFQKAHRHIKKNRAIIFCGGIGNPLFSTDTCSILRAIEMNCDVVIKGTSVDGVYSADPKINPNATRYQNISYADVISQNLNIMDRSAIIMASENKMPIFVTSITSSNMPLFDIITGIGKYSIIT